MEVMMFCFTRSCNCNEGITLTCVSIFVPRHVTPPPPPFLHSSTPASLCVLKKQNKRERLLDGELFAYVGTYILLFLELHACKLDGKKRKESENPTVCAWEILKHVFLHFHHFYTCWCRVGSTGWDSWYCWDEFEVHTFCSPLQ